MGFAAGYYLGAKAGRQRYLQLRRLIERLSGHSGASTDSDGKASVALEMLPAEVRSRVMAATAHADYRTIERLADEEGSGERYEVYALAGDRLVHMILGQRTDGSVAEETESVLRQQIVEVVLGDEEATVEVQEGAGLRRIPVPLGLVPALAAEGG